MYTTPHSMKNLVVVSVFLISVKFIRALQNHIQIKSPKDCIRLSSGGSALDTLPSVMSSNREHIGSCIDNAVTLVLNADYKPLSYMPLSIWNWQDSLRAVLSDKAYVVSEFEDLSVRSVSAMYFLPSVIVLKSFHSRPTKIPVMSRRNVYYRDNFCCQYCSQSFDKNQKSLTLDHLVPRSRGGKLTWLNTVTACTSCNFMKGHTLPEDLPRIGMKLKSAPRIPSYSELQYKAKLYSKTQIHPHWTDFI